jgi:hypothetical protein
MDTTSLAEIAFYGGALTVAAGIGLIVLGFDEMTLLKTVVKDIGLLIAAIGAIVFILSLTGIMGEPPSCDPESICGIP